jgi:hypothetical protein
VRQAADAQYAVLPRGAHRRRRVRRAFLGAVPAHRRDQHRLFGADAVAVRFDPVLFARQASLPIDWASAIPAVEWDEADADDWPPEPEAAAIAATQLIDVVGRLAAELRREVPVMAVMPGPGRLAAPGAAADREERATRLLRGLVDAICQAGANIVLLEEDGVESAALLAPIVNTIRYFNAAPILAVPGLPDKMPADAILLPAAAWQAADPAPRRCGVSIPADCVDDAAKLDDFRARLRAAPAPVFLSMGDEVALGHQTADGVAAHQALANTTFDAAT